MKTLNVTAAEITRRLRRVAELRRFCRALRGKNQPATLNSRQSLALRAGGTL